MPFLPSMQDLSVGLCTFNLHLLLCRLMDQVLERGLTWRYGELWVERLIGEFKQRTKYRTHAEPELTMMRDYMLRSALKMVRLSSGQELLTWQEYKAKHKTDPQASAGSAVDRGCSAAWGQLLGVGRVLGVAAWTPELQAKVQQALKRGYEGGVLERSEYNLWVAGWDVMTVFKHERAFLSEGGYATSASYGRSRTRDGSYVTVTYEVGGELRPHVAQVQYYLRLHLPEDVTGDVPMDMRVAISDFLPYKEPFEDEDLCEFLLFGEEKRRRQDTFSDLDYPVLLSNIEAPLFVHRFKGANGAACMAFAPLRFKTGGPRARAGKGDEE